jgi:hypothetical protein
VLRAPPGRTSGASLVRALVKSGATTRFLLAAPLKLLSDLSSLATPLVFERLIRWASSPASVQSAVGLVTLMFCLSLADVFIRPQYMALCGDSGIRAERSIALLLQRKALRLDAGCRDSSAGKIISLLTVDAKTAGPESFQYLHLCWAAPFQGEWRRPSASAAVMAR